MESFSTATSPDMGQAAGGRSEVTSGGDPLGVENSLILMKRTNEKEISNGKKQTAGRSGPLDRDHREFQRDVAKLD